MTNETITFRINAHEMYGEAGLEAHADVTTRADAEAIAALFPKSAKVYGTRCCGKRGDEWTEWGLVKFQVGFTKDGVTGQFNETGLKRYRSFRRACNNLGFEVVWTAPYANSFKTEDGFESYITQEA